MVTTADGYSLLRWPCGSIHWAIEPGATAAEAAKATAAVGELAVRTGRNFIFDGAGSPDDPSVAQLVISFNPARVPTGALGYGGPIKGQGKYNFQIVGARAFIAAPPAAQMQILRHELGHAMALDNVDVATEVMYWQYSPLNGWGPGTEHALANLGPCRP